MKYHITNKTNILFNNDYCTIFEDNDIWTRFDKVLQTTMIVTSYFDKNGTLHKNKTEYDKMRDVYTC